MTGRVTRILEERSALAREDRARWRRDHPLREPGTSLRTWASISQQRRPSEAYRRGYEQIQWRRP